MSAILLLAVIWTVIWADIIITGMLFLVFISIIYQIQKKGGKRHLCLIYGGFYLLSYLIVTHQCEQSDQFTSQWISNKSHEVTGTIECITQKEYGQSILLKHVYVDEHEKTAHLLLTGENLPVCVGDIIKVTGSVQEMEHGRNEGAFDSKTYYGSIGIFQKLRVQKYEILKEDRKSLYYHLAQWKSGIKEIYHQISEQKDYGMFVSMVLGEKDALDTELKELYQRNGIVHLLAISGLHISLIGMSTYRGLRKTGVGIGCSAVCGISLIVVYALLTGFGISAIRAMFMCCGLIVANLMGRCYDSLSMLSLAAVLLMFENPYVIKNVGFLLSFLAVLGIVFVFPVFHKLIEKRKKRWYYPACASFFISCAVMGTTLPVLLYFYYTFSPVSLLLNVLVVPLMTLLMLSAILAVVVGSICPLAGMFVLSVGHDILWLYEQLCRITERIPYAQITIGRPSGVAIVLYYSTLFLLLVCYHTREQWFYHQKVQCFFTYIERKNKKSGGTWKEQQKKYMCILYTIFMLGMSMALFILLHKKTLGFEIDMLDVGQGDGIFLSTDNDTYYLFDGGSSSQKELAKYTLEPFLAYKGISVIDYAVISHSDEDHISGIMDLLQRGQIWIKTLVLPEIIHAEQDANYCRLLDCAYANGVQVQFIHTGGEIGSGQVRISCIHPQKNYVYQSPNEYSAVYMIQYKNFKTLMTGDAENYAENAMLQDNNLSDIDVLKTGHHGSKSSSSEAFLDKLKPEVAIISCGKNNRYHHPSKEVIQRFEKKKIIAYVTAQNGQIQIKSDGYRYQIACRLSQNST